MKHVFGASYILYHLWIYFYKLITIIYAYMERYCSNYNHNQKWHYK